jgi:hypothetical protein
MSALMPWLYDGATFTNTRIPFQVDIVPLTNPSLVDDYLATWTRWQPASIGTALLC